MGDYGATVFNFGGLAWIVITLLVIAFAVICIVRKVKLSPWLFWVLFLGLCIVSVTFAILGNETAVWECLIFAGVTFCVGCIGLIFKK